LPAAAGDEILRFDGLGLIGRDIAYCRGDAIIGFDKSLKPTLIASVTLGKLSASSRRMGSKKVWLQRCERSGVVGSGLSPP
jgi:hypothetical protein